LRRGAIRSSAEAEGAIAIQALLFERPLLLVPVLVACQLLLIHFWSKYRTRTTMRLMLVGFVVFPLMVLLQAVVTTDRERLVQVCRAMAEAVESADTHAFSGFVSDDFALSGDSAADLAKEDLVKKLERFLMTYDIEDARLRQFEIQVDGERATVVFTAHCRVVASEVITPGSVSKWQCRFQREGDSWRMIHVEPRPTPLFPFSRLRDIPG